jgi:hypothetical protein
MKILRIALLSLCALGLGRAAEAQTAPRVYSTQAEILASALVIPNTYTNGQVISAAIVNQNFQAIAAWANGNVDFSNIGVNGIYASQILPTTTAQAAFGGTVSYSMPAGLQVQNPGGCLNLGLPADTSCTTIGGSGGAMNLSVQPGQNFAFLTSNGTATTGLADILSNGTMTVNAQGIPGTAGGGAVLPTYFNSGGVPAATSHFILTTCVASGTTCTSSLGAQFVNSHSYSCFSSQGGANPAVTQVTNINANSVQLTLASSATGDTYTIGCIGV